MTTIVHLKDWQHRRPRRVVPRSAPLPPIEPPAMQDPDAQSRADDRRRMRENLGALAVVCMIVFLGGWLIDRIQTYARIQACIDYGHHNCVPLSIGHLTRPEHR